MTLMPYLFIVFFFFCIHAVLLPVYSILDLSLIPLISVKCSFLSMQSPREMLAQSVLAEVPGQVVGFFNNMHLKPPNTEGAP